MAKNIRIMRRRVKKRHSKPKNIEFLIFYFLLEIEKKFSLHYSQSYFSNFTLYMINVKILQFREQHIMHHSLLYKVKAVFQLRVFYT